MRKADFLEGGAFGFEFLQHAFDSSLAFGGETFAEVFLRDANHLALDAGIKLCGKVFGRASAGGVVVRVDAADSTEEGGGILNGCTEGADLVQGASVSQETVTGDAAVGGLQAHNACAGGGLTNGTTGVGAERTGDRATGHGYGRTATGTTRNAGLVERVHDLTEIGGLVARTHGEFVHVGLPDDDCTGSFELFDSGSSVGSDKVFENLGSGRGARTFDAHIVLHGDGDSVEGAQCLAFSTTLVGFGCLLKSAFVQYANVGVQVLGRFNLI